VAAAVVVVVPPLGVTVVPRLSVPGRFILRVVAAAVVKRRMSVGRVALCQEAGRPSVALRVHQVTDSRHHPQVASKVVVAAVLRAVAEALALHLVLLLAGVQQPILVAAAKAVVAVLTIMAIPVAVLERQCLLSSILQPRLMLTR